MHFPLLRSGRSLAAAWITALSIASVAHAQSNVIPGTDVKLGALGSLQLMTHQGTFPSGLVAVSMSTTSCNVGTVNVPWQQAMNSNHPFIAFLYTRVRNGRMEQISDRSFVKHGFFALSNSQCTPCQNPSNGTFLGVGCSDTYSTGNNADNYWLGPPEEIDPWLGTWVPQCSHFDHGQPAVNPPNDCDGVRSLTSGQANALGPVGHRVQIQDADLAFADASYYYQGQYVIRGEPTTNRDNNLASRVMLASWNGSAWSIAGSGTQLEGSILKRWSGATVTTVDNGGDDGRVHLGVVATPSGNVFHYEYAIHNQDSYRGVGAIRIPLAPGAQVTNAGFRDIDGNVANDWTVQQVGNELRFETSGNPVEWNTIYNVFFDCSASPVAGNVLLDAFLAGNGLPTLSAASVTPEGNACPSAATYCVSKINSDGCAPIMGFTGQASASAGSGFNLNAVLVKANANAVLMYSKTGASSAPFFGGTLCVAPPVRRVPGLNSGGASLCGGQLDFDFNAYIASGSDTALVAGQSVWAQFWQRDPVDVLGVGLTDGVSFSICP